MYTIVILLCLIYFTMIIIQACAPGGDNTYLINAFGLLYPEVTASNLVRVNLQGDVLDPGSTSLGINRDGYALHSAIHEARTDIKCIIHLHTNAGIAVSHISKKNELIIIFNYFSVS